MKNGILIGCHQGISGKMLEYLTNLSKISLIQKSNTIS